MGNKVKKGDSRLTLALLLTIISPCGGLADDNQQPNAGNGNSAVPSVVTQQPNSGGNGMGMRRFRRRRMMNGQANAAGPGWIPGGQDNAQNPQMLKRRMKMQERRQLQQYDQAVMQIKEQQQQDYEKAMLQKLGSQRPAIKQGHKEVEEVRQSTGANNQ